MPASILSTPMSSIESAPTTIQNSSDDGSVSLFSQLSLLAKAVYSGFMNIIGIPFDLIQKYAGIERIPYLFLLPNFLIFGTFTLLPVMLNVYYSFTGGGKPFIQDRPLVGVENYSHLFECDSFFDANSCREDLFWSSIPRTITYVIATVFFTLLFSLITALALNRPIRAKGLFRSVFFYPVMLSPVVVAFIWRWIVRREGVLNALLTGLDLNPINFMVSPGWATFWVVFLGVWASMGFYTLIILAGLQGIPPELYEAAKMDGAVKWQSFRHVTLPLLGPTMLVVLVLVVIRSVQVFDHVYAFTTGGPGTATRYLVHYIVDTGFSTYPRNFGLAAAASVLMLIALGIITLIQLSLSRQVDENY